MNGYINLNKMTTISINYNISGNTEYPYFVVFNDGKKKYSLGCRDKEEAEEKMKHVYNCFRNGGLFRINQKTVAVKECSTDNEA